MQSSGLDPFIAGTYDLYQSNDGYVYRAVPNVLSQYSPAADADRLPDVVEPPDTHSMTQRGNSVAMTSYWHSPNQPVSVALYQDFQGPEDLSQLAPDIRLTSSRGLEKPSKHQVTIVSNDPPFTRLITPPDRYYNASFVHIEGNFPPYVPNNDGYAHPSSPAAPTVPQSAHTTAGPSEEDEAQDLEHEELPLIKLPFGVWKCGVCDKQLRRKHRAVVHFLNKHGDMRLSCQGRCGVVDCRKTFASQDGLDVHLNPVVIECTFCGKSLLKKNILRHRSRHCHPIINKEVPSHGPLSNSE